MNSRNLPWLPKRRDQLQKSLHLRLLRAKSFPLRFATGAPSPRPKYKVLPPRRLSGGRKV